MAESSFSGGKSAEEIAYMLMDKVINSDRRAPTKGNARNPDEADELDTRTYILDAYAECLLTVRDPAGRKK